jgi:hypothetical protein
MSGPPDEYAMWLERAISGANVGELQRSHDQLLQAIKRIDPITLAETSESVYKSDGTPRILVPFLHSWFVLEFLPYRIKGEHQLVDTLPMKVLVLEHLMTAAENQGTAVRVMGKWIDCRSLQHGAVLGAHFAKTTDKLLGEFFALEREKRIARVLQWGGKPLELGDEGYVFRFFPRLPVAIINWRGDEELPAFSKILFDVSASNYMPTHGLAVLTEFLAHRLAHGDSDLKERNASEP